MKKLTNNIFITVILNIIISLACKAQTNVSGGIFANTTWTKANSPYIVIDTTVVFPGVTLTIEPGVLVKFDDNKYLELRQASLIAIGTATDSITFTSNSATPTAGIWGHSTNGGIWFNTTSQTAVKFWNMAYATIGIYSGNISYIQNSTFTNNGIGVYGISNIPVDFCIFKFNDTGIGSLSSTLNHCTISNNYNGIEDSQNSVLNSCIFESNNTVLGGIVGYVSNTKFHDCTIRYNNNGVVGSKPLGGNLYDHCIVDSNTVFGILAGINAHDTIINCEIKYNGEGIRAFAMSLITHNDIEFDTIGLAMHSTGANIYCNKICNNISYGLQMYSSGNFNVSDNYWCTTDSSQIAAEIYDGYDNVNFGLVTFLPVDLVQCYTVSGIPDYETQPGSFTIFPNPADDYLTIEFPSNISDAKIKIFNIIGELMKSTNLTSQKEKMDVSDLTSGVYILEVMNGKNISRQRFVKQKNSR